MPASPCPPRRRGFTLIELLTVVAIISLLIGILLPSLSRARDQAKKAKVAGMLSAIDKSLEMFYNDFKDYPESSLRFDAVDKNWPASGGLPPPPALVRLSGAHWLARALVGHDSRGIDAKGATMRAGDSSAGNELDYNNLVDADRKSAYMEGEIFFRDDNPDQFATSASVSDFQPTGRLVVAEDAFKSPILYYRANPRAKAPFTENETATSSNFNPAAYSLRDNELITGNDAAGIAGWDFSGKGGVSSSLAHWLGIFGVKYDASVPGRFKLDPNETRSFGLALYSESTLKSTSVLKPMNADRFILMSAGKDGIYGTDDDITNFKSGL